jgi:hypothetical protein
LTASFIASSERYRQSRFGTRNARLNGLCVGLLCQSASGSQRSPALGQNPRNSLQKSRLLSFSRAAALDRADDITVESGRI